LVLQGLCGLLLAPLLFGLEERVELCPRWRVIAGRPALGLPHGSLLEIDGIDPCLRVLCLRHGPAYRQAAYRRAA